MATKRQDVDDESDSEDVSYDDTDADNMEDYDNKDCIIDGRKGKDKLWPKFHNIANIVIIVQILFHMLIDYFGWDVDEVNTDSGDLIFAFEVLVYNTFYF